MPLNSSEAPTSGYPSTRRPTRRAAAIAAQKICKEVVISSSEDEELEEGTSLRGGRNDEKGDKKREGSERMGHQLILLRNNNKPTETALKEDKECTFGSNHEVTVGHTKDGQYQQQVGTIGEKPIVKKRKRRDAEEDDPDFEGSVSDGQDDDREEGHHDDDDDEYEPSEKRRRRKTTSTGCDSSRQRVAYPVAPKKTYSIPPNPLAPKLTLVKKRQINWLSYDQVVPSFILEIVDCTSLLDEYSYVDKSGPGMVAIKEKPNRADFEVTDKDIIGDLEMTCESIDEGKENTVCVCSEEVVSTSQYLRQVRAKMEWDSFVKKLEGLKATGARISFTSPEDALVFSQPKVPILPKPGAAAPVVISASPSVRTGAAPVTTGSMFTIPGSGPASTSHNSLGLRPGVTYLLIRTPGPSSGQSATGQKTVIRTVAPAVNVTRLAIPSPASSGISITYSRNRPQLLAPSAVGQLPAPRPAARTTIQTIRPQAAPSIQPKPTTQGISFPSQEKRQATPMTLLMPTSTPSPAVMNVITSSAGQLSALNRQKVNDNLKTKADSVCGNSVLVISDNLNAAESASARNRLYDSLALVRGVNNRTALTANVLLSIKPLPFSWPTNVNTLIQSLVKLDNALMKDKFKESPSHWMVTKGLCFYPQCFICKRSMTTLSKYKAKNDNDQWHCSCSNISIEPVKPPTMFRAFNMNTSKLLFIIYYWSIQVDVEDLVKSGQIDVDINLIYKIWRKLQEVCCNVVVTKRGMLGSKPEAVVEVASVQVGRLYILGAMELGSSDGVKLAVIQEKDIGLAEMKKINLFVEKIKQWVHPKCTIRACESKFVAIKNYGYKMVLVSKSNFVSGEGSNQLNRIGGYMIQHFQRLFKDIATYFVDETTLTLILSELQWRESYGTDPFTAFTNMVKHLADAHRDSLRVNNFAGASNNPHQQASRPPSPQPSTSSELDYVYVDEYYYSTLQLKKKTGAKVDSVHRIQCNLCQMVFDSFSMAYHLIEHIETSRATNRRRSLENLECNHCLRLFPEKVFELHQNLWDLKMKKFSCRICCVPFGKRNPYIEHMKVTHFAGEMPYYCDACCYRSSFHKDVINHFAREHKAVVKVLCPFCLKCYGNERDPKNSTALYEHLAQHFSMASIYDCSRCCLTFTSKQDLSSHHFKGHDPLKTYDEVFDILPYHLSDEEKVMSVQAHESELFAINLPPNVVLDSKCQVNDSEGEEDEEMESESAIESESRGTKPFRFDSRECATSSRWEDVALPEVNYSSEHLKRILSTCDFAEEKMSCKKSLVTHNRVALTCKECDQHIDADHYKNATSCPLCSYSTHCKKAENDHMVLMHPKKSTGDKSKVASLLGYRSTVHAGIRLKCGACPFVTAEGNKMAHHISTTNHIFCTL